MATNGDGSTSAGGSDAALNEVLAAYLQDVEAGRAPDRQALLDRHPELAADLDAFFADQAEFEQATEPFRRATAPTLQAPLDEQPGTQIGPYKLLQQIGEGGMGVVFLAEQVRPVRRQVALKVIKPGMDSRQVIARFEAERQALAMMDHEKIAKVFDAGSTASGRPYFVMELVRGVPITAYCDAQRLTPRQRLELFTHVCQAVHHAHQKGVIHRDLKPSNVMVALYDGKPVPKVIDFGVAKATGGRLTDSTLFTGFGTMVGTLEYMSPEQAELNQLDVDTRSDVYALGVLLYELLTGTTPFDPADLRGRAYDEMRRIIREVVPPKPSTRLAARGDLLAGVAARQGTEPGRLGRAMRKELDWVVMKCLEKQPDRRYESASALASDVRRYLNDRPVEARPPSAAYRLRKFARRNKGLIAAVAAVLLALVAGFVAATAGFLRARTERARAEAALARAVRATGILNTEILPLIDPKRADLSVFTLHRIVRELNSDAMKDQPEVEASVRRLVAKAYKALGMPAEAEAEFHNVLATRRRVLGERHLDVAESLNDLAVLARGNGDAAGAKRFGDEAAAVLRGLDAGAAEGTPPELLEFAIALARASDAIRRDPAEARYWEARGTLHARRAEFRQAEADYTAAIERDRQTHWRWFYRAFLRLRLGDVAGYRGDCREMLSRFGQTTDPWAAERTAKACFASPHASGGGDGKGPVDLDAPMKSLDERMAARTLPPGAMPWFHLARGMGHYRHRRYDQAIDDLLKSQNHQDQATALATADFFLAMAYHRQGRDGEARDALRRGDERVASAVPPEASRALGEGVENWIACHAARDEATAMIMGASRPTGSAPTTNATTDAATTGATNP